MYNIGKKFVVKAGVEYDGQVFSGFSGAITDKDEDNNYKVKFDGDSVDRMSREYLLWCYHEGFDVDETYFHAEDIIIL